MTGDTQLVADVRPPKRYRNAMYVGVLLMGITAILAVAYLIPTARDAARKQDTVNREATCRAKVSYATSAVNAALIVDQADAFQAAIDKQAVSTPIDAAALSAAFHRDRSAAAVLRPIQADVVNICHKNPDYALPPEALNSGAP